MDAEAVYAAMSEAVEQTRRGDGPAFVECLTYRFVGHHTAEPTMRLAYRTDDEIARWRLRDPLDVVGERLDQDERAQIDAEVEHLLEDAVQFARSSPRPIGDEALDFVYASGPPPRAGAV